MKPSTKARTIAALYLTGLITSCIAFGIILGTVITR